jgi:hypothetical protein
MRREEAAVAGGRAAHLAGHLGWGHPLLFTLIGDCGYAVCAACISVAMVIVNRPARRDRRAGLQERSDREQLRGRIWPRKFKRCHGDPRMRPDG